MRDKFYSNTRYIVKTGAQDLSTMFKIPSGPGSALVFRFCKSLRTTILSAIISGIRSYGGNEFQEYPGNSLEKKNELKVRFKLLALSASAATETSSYVTN